MISKRERYLVVVVVGIVGCYGLFLAVRGLFVGPLEAQATQIRTLTGEIASKNKQMEEAHSANQKLTEWESISLPGEEGKAQALYQDYLFKLMRDYNFEEPQVSAEKTQRSKSFSSIPFTIRGRVSLENLTEFLYRFHAYEHRILHQVRSLNIVRPDGKSKNLSVTIVVAALALDDAPHRGPLIASGENPREVTIDDVPLDKFQAIAKTNIFEPFVEPTKEPDKPEIDAARHVVYSGYTLSGDAPEAWIYDRLNNQNRFLKTGDSLDVAGLKAKIVSIAASKIVLEMNDKQFSLKLGKNLREMTDLGGSVAQSNESSPDKSADSEKAQEVVPAESSSDDRPETSAEKTGKIGPTVPVKKEAAEPASEVIKADSGS
jgi:hypothetical protein